jgi:hypothetical protein
MDNICDSNLTGEHIPTANDLSQVVHLHMSQIQELESKHKLHLEELKVQFKKQFRKFVYDLYDDMTDPDGLAIANEIDEDMLKQELGTFKDGLEMIYNRKEDSSGESTPNK